MVSKAFLPLVNGHHALLVFMISSVPSVFFTSHVRPDPKFPTALEIIVSWNFSKFPRVVIMAAKIAHVGILFSLGT